MTDLSRMEFNPYHKWLGIPPEACPPNHYRLLGLELFEDDPEVISTAADRQMVHVKSFATGPFARASQELLNQLSQARICLLNEERKQAYDRQLQEQVASSEPPPVEASEWATPPPPTFPDMAVAEAPVPLRIKRRRRRKKSVLAPLLLMTLGIGVVAGLLFYASQQAPIDRQVAQDNPQPVVAHPPTSPADPSDDTPVDTQGGPRGALSADGPSPPDEIGSNETDPEKLGSGNLGAGRGENREEPEQPLGQPSRPLIPFPSEGNVPEEDFPLPGSPRPPPRRESISGLVAKLPFYVDLPALIESSPVELFSLASASRPLSVDVRLVSADYLARGPRQLFLHAAEEGEWLVFEESPEIRRQLIEGEDVDSTLPFAKLRFDEGRLLFQWTNDPTYRDQGDRLRHCLLHLVTDSGEQKIQLRTPAGDSVPIDIGSLDEKYVHVIEVGSLEPLPPVGALQLALTMLPGFPATGLLEGDPEKVPAESQLYLEFTQLSYAGVGAYWQLKGRRLSIAVSPGFRLRSAPNDIVVLSRNQVAQAKSNLTTYARRIERELNQRVNSRQKLRNNLEAANRINITLPGGGTSPALIAQKKIAIDKAERDIVSNEERITYLNSQTSAIKLDLSQRIPALESLASELEGHAAVGFELYVPAGDDRVVIYRQGMDADQ